MKLLKKTDKYLTSIMKEKYVVTEFNLVILLLWTCISLSIMQECHFQAENVAEKLIDKVLCY